MAKPAEVAPTYRNVVDVEPYKYNLTGNRLRDAKKKSAASKTKADAEDEGAGGGTEGGSAGSGSAGSGSVGGGTAGGGHTYNIYGPVGSVHGRGEVSGGTYNYGGGVQPPAAVTGETVHPDVADESARRRAGNRGQRTVTTRRRSSGQGEGVPTPAATPPTGAAPEDKTPSVTESATSQREAGNVAPGQNDSEEPVDYAAVNNPVIDKPGKKAKRTARQIQVQLGQVQRDDQGAPASGYLPGDPAHLGDAAEALRAVRPGGVARAVGSALGGAAQVATDAVAARADQRAGRIRDVMDAEKAAAGDTDMTPIAVSNRPPSEAWTMDIQGGHVASESPSGQGALFSKALNPRLFNDVHYVDTGERYVPSGRAPLEPESRTSLPIAGSSEVPGQVAAFPQWNSGQQRRQQNQRARALAAANSQRDDFNQLFY